MLDFRILVHPFLLESTKDELTALAVTVAAIILFSLIVAKKRNKKEAFGQ